MVDDNGDYSDTVYSRRGYCGTLCWRPYLDVSAHYPVHYYNGGDADPTGIVNNQAGTLV